MAAQEPKPAEAPTVPAGAVQVEPYTYRFVDAQGKKWIYRETPFGVVKREDKPADQPVADSGPPTTVTDAGESVKFERKTPFGIQSWTKKKVELSDDEKALVDRAKPAEKQ